MTFPFYFDPQAVSYCGDNEEVLRDLPENSLDMIFTSPPYYLKRRYKIEDKIFDNHNGCSHVWHSAGFKDSHPDRSSGGHDSNGNGIFLDRIERGAQGSRVARGEGFEMGQFCLSCRAWKGQLGLEPDPDLYIKHLCDVFDLCKRPLKKTGSLWVNIGDTYAGSGGGYNILPCIHDRNRGRLKNIDQAKISFKAQISAISTKNFKPFKNIPSKSLIGIPHRFMIEMVNRGWICRNSIIRHSSNCMPSSARDRFTVDYEFIFWFTISNTTRFWVNANTLQAVNKKPAGIHGIENIDWHWIDCPYCLYKPEKQSACKKCQGSGKVKENYWTGYDYFFDQQFEPQTGNAHPRGSEENSLAYQFARNSFIGFKSPTTVLAAGRNKSSIWTINAIGSNEEHYATFPKEICTTPIIATCPEFICSKCGIPRFKVYQRSGGTLGKSWVDHQDNVGKGLNQPKPYFSNIHHMEERGDIDPYQIIYKGLSDCGCGASFQPGVTADIFAGTGTVGLAARNLNRKIILIDISQEYCQIQRKKLLTGK
jgi:DNA modification methylase